MVENEKGGIIDVVKDGLGLISQVISASIVPPIIAGADAVMTTIEERILQIEKRVLRKISSLVVIMCGGVFLIFALYFFLKEYVGWSNAEACFSIGVLVLVIGLFLKIGESNK